MEIPIKLDDLGGKPTIFGNIQLFSFFIPHITKTQIPWIRHGPNPSAKKRDCFEARSSNFLWLLEGVVSNVVVVENDAKKQGKVLQIFWYKSWESKGTHPPMPPKNRVVGLDVNLRF